MLARELVRVRGIGNLGNGGKKESKGRGKGKAEREV